MRIARFDEVTPPNDQRNAFDCGEPSLNRWLATQASQSMASRDAVTYLLLDGPAESDLMSGDFCLAARSIATSR